ncbi:MAG: glycosyltransferase [Candidatus Omnitrophica bacterium]|jgi:SAM-dependent methyltransferase|nr:glycosyltransferase [Candidatus Omnitrophota bacterium]MDD5518225.1 glycosyltransferase [Candidatus Omnitrophota bacterium]
MEGQPLGNFSYIDFKQARIAHWDGLSRSRDKQSGWGGHYHRRLAEIYRFSVRPNQRVLEIGCGYGDLLSALKPSLGVGVDFSEKMVRQAQERHPELQFIQADAQELSINAQFDVIILSDLVNDLWDVQSVFEKLHLVSTPQTRVICNFYSNLWMKPLQLAQNLKVAQPLLPQNWLTREDITNLFYLTDFEVIRSWAEILCPLPVPGLEGFANRFLVKFWPFSIMALTNFIIARPKPRNLPAVRQPSVSVIIPVRNESGNIAQIFERMQKETGKETELIFVEGHSTDNSFEVIRKYIADYPALRCKLFKQEGTGKGEAVRLGFTHANGDILVILDADLTVSPEDLGRFYACLCTGRAEFVNGVRLVYPWQQKAMRFLNLLANKFFSIVFSWLIGQQIKDTLCGTKALWRKDYLKIAENRRYFGDFDPFGDYDLIFGAAALNLKIVDMPVRYYERQYGKTNIRRWRHGWLLLRMVFFAARKIKFI